MKDLAHFNSWKLNWTEQSSRFKLVTEWLKPAPSENWIINEDDYTWVDFYRQEMSLKKYTFQDLVLKGSLLAVTSDKLSITWRRYHVLFFLSYIRDLTLLYLSRFRNWYKIDYLRTTWQWFGVKYGIDSDDNITFMF